MVRDCIHCPLLASEAEPDSEVSGTAPYKEPPEAEVHTKGFSLLVVRKWWYFSVTKTLSHPGGRMVVSPESLQVPSK